MYDAHTHVSQTREIRAYHVARRLNVSVRTVRWWAETGRLSARREGLKIWKFLENDVEAFRAKRVTEADLGF